MKIVHILILITCLGLAACNKSNEKKVKSEVGEQIISRETLTDKIKGGWAGQVIGCTFGGPTEFKFRGSMINDYQPIPWNEGRCLWYYDNFPGLYDDIYMDLTFVDVFEREGLDAPASAHALAFAQADYLLWHANQAARYNILNGIMPPESGYWELNPHSEDIDFQIEADFAGLMAPGLVNTASEICDKIGHIMTYGDGWYGGVYVAAMYSLAFLYDDVEYVVRKALKSIPEESRFYKCIDDVVKWHKQYPDDWKQTWFETEKKWSADYGCPAGVFTDLNIDAKINSAYIVIGLLYGEGDFTKTLEISTRCGQDSDCNPASAGGILGTMMGYSNIPEYWKKPIYPVEDMDFGYTTMSLNDVYKIGTKHAIEVLNANGATWVGESVKIPVQKIKPVRLEVGFKGHFPINRIGVNKSLSISDQKLIIEFEGNGFVITGGVYKINASASEIELELEMTIDGGEPKTFKMPSRYDHRKHEVAWKYNLPEGSHRVTLKLLNPSSDFTVRADDLITYSSEEKLNAWQTGIN